MRINSWCGWDRLEEAWVGRHYSPNFFNGVKNDKIRSPLQKLSDETEEDYQNLIKILEDFGVEKILRPQLDLDARLGDTMEKKFYSHSCEKPSTNPRDYHWVYGNKLYRFEAKSHYNDIYAEYKSQGCDVYDPYVDNTTPATNEMEAPSMVRFGDAVIVDAVTNDQRKWLRKELPDTKIFWWPRYQGHRDGMFCPVKPGLIVSLADYREDEWHQKLFKDWEYIYLPNESWEKVMPIGHKIKGMLDKTFNKYYIANEEHNDELIHFINKYLSEWVGYCAESVFDVNMLVLDQSHVVVNSYNKIIFDAFKRHKIEPIICNLRHRYFWDGGLHCNTLDIRRSGKKERYLTY